MKKSFKLLLESQRPSVSIARLTIMGCFSIFRSNITFFEGYAQQLRRCRDYETAREYNIHEGYGIGDVC